MHITNFLQINVPCHQPTHGYWISTAQWNLYLEFALAAESRYSLFCGETFAHTAAPRTNPGFFATECLQQTSGPDELTSHPSPLCFNHCPTNLSPLVENMLPLHRLEMGDDKQSIYVCQSLVQKEFFTYQTQTVPMFSNLNRSCLTELLQSICLFMTFYTFLKSLLSVSVGAVDCIIVLPCFRRSLFSCRSNSPRS